MLGLGIFTIFLVFLAEGISGKVIGPNSPIVCPQIVTREEWGGRPPRSFTPMPNPVPYAVIHHSVMSSCNTTTSCEASLREIQDFHMDTNGWDDVGYSFLIGGDARVYQGRGWNRVGAHAPAVNDKSIGICIIGDFQTELPTQAQLDAAKTLIECGVGNDYIIEEYVLLGHRDVRDTECPGEALYQEILTWPHKGLPRIKESKSN